MIQFSESASSQFELVEESAVENVFSFLSAVVCSNEAFDLLGAESLSINDFKHTLVLNFLAMLTIDQECDRRGSHFLSKVAQIHERTFGEKAEVGVAQPNVELCVGLIEETSVTVDSLSATESCLSLKEIFYSRL